MEKCTEAILKYNSVLLEDMVSVKFRLMKKSMYSFFRGTCHLYYEDLSAFKKIPFSPLTWTCGDLHMENFGSFKGDNRLVYFDLNDFDEAVLAPASWELSRFITSVFIAFDSLDIEHAKALNMAKLYLKSYSQTLANGKPYYLEPKTSKGIVRAFLMQARNRKKKTLLEKRTKKTSNGRIIEPGPKHLRLEKDLKEDLFVRVTDWIMNHSGSPYNYSVVDAVFRVSGLGSLGLKRYLLLLKSTNVIEKYLLVDMKQSKHSALEPFLNVKQPQWNKQSDRIIEVQKRMQNIPPALLSTLDFRGEHFVMQEMQPSKDGIKLHMIKHQYRNIIQVVDDMGMLSASAQLRSSGRQNAASADELILFGQNTEWQEYILDYALKYTEKVKRDYQAFCSEKTIFS